MAVESTTASCLRQQLTVIGAPATVQPMVVTPSKKLLAIFRHRLHLAVAAKKGIPKEAGLDLYNWLKTAGGITTWQGAEKWWKGKSIPSAVNLRQLAIALETTPAYLRGETPELHSPLSELIGIWRNLSDDAKRGQILNFARFVRDGQPSQPVLAADTKDNHADTMTGSDIDSMLDL